MRKIDVVRLLIDEKIRLMSKVIQDIKSREIIVQELWHLRFMLSDCENVDNSFDKDKMVDLSKLQHS